MIPAHYIPYKQWVIEEAQRRRVGMYTIYERVCDGEYPELHRRVINARVIFVPPWPVAWIVKDRKDGRVKYDFSGIDWSKERNTNAVARRFGCSFWTARNARLRASQ